MRYLLDTNIVSDLVRNPQGKVAQHIRKFGETPLFRSGKHPPNLNQSHICLHGWRTTMAIGRRVLGATVAV
jgi:hypothetical protein